MKKFLCYAFITTLAALAICFSFEASVTMAEEESDNVLTAWVLNRNTDALYHKFDSPSDILVTPDGLIVKVNGGYETYADKQFAFSHDNADDYAYLDGLISLSQGDILYYNNKIEGEYTAISVYDKTLYAQYGKNIDKFVMDGGILVKSEQVESSEYDITHIAATEDGCLYSVIDPRNNMSVIYLNGRSLYQIEDDIIDLSYDQNTYVLTPSNIICYFDNYTSEIFDISRGTALSVGDKVYVLTRLGSVEAVSLDLASSQTLIATGGEADWFYSQPVSGDARLNKIYVVDRAIGNDRTNGRIAVIDGDKITYLKGLKQPVAVAADNEGRVYVAHKGNYVACFFNDKLERDAVFTDENIVDLCVDSGNVLYALTESGKVISNGDTVMENVTALEYSNGLHYMTEGHIGDIEVDATDFCVDILGNMFCISGNKVISIIGGEKTEYTVQNAATLSAITLSKVDNDYIDYGDLILFDEINQCVFVLDGNSVGSANIKELFTAPQLDSTPNDRYDGIIGVPVVTTYMFALPVEGQITRTLTTDDRVIICKDISSPQPFVYCICDDLQTQSLSCGYVYAESLRILQYVSPKSGEAKVNADNTPVYKYPSINAPEIGRFEKNRLVSIMSFAYTDESEDGSERWYCDVYNNVWRRIAFGEQDKEGYILNTNLNNEFFKNVEMPKPNATITKDTKLYRYDEESHTYVEFEAIGSNIAKDTRVMVDTPFDSSREFTKVVFYRENYGTVDVECFVRTEDVKFDGADIVKIIAAAVIVLAVITLIVVIVIKRKNSRRPQRRPIEDE